MSAKSEFDEVYTRLSGSRPLYMSLKHLTTGIPRWRLHIYEKNTAGNNAGDMELLCIEKPTKEESLREGTEKLRKLFK